MFSETVAGVIAGTKAHARLNELSQDIWKAWGAGMLDDAEAGRLSGLLEERRTKVRLLDTTAIRAPHVARHIALSCFPPRRRQPTSPDRATSMERRRRLASSGPMPPSLACKYTTGELAALRIVADEVRDKGVCAVTVGEIATRAGVGITTARNALRAAALDGLVTIEERRRHRAPNLPNVIRIISAEWRDWIAKGGRGQGGGFKKVESTDIGILNPVNFRQTSRSKVGFRRSDGAEIEPQHGSKSYGRQRK